MSEESRKADIDEIERMEFEIFKKYWQPMMKELIELQELKASVPEGEVGTVKKMADELDTLRKSFEELKGMVAGLTRPQMVQPPLNNQPYNPGLSHMPLYRPGAILCSFPCPTGITNNNGDETNG